MYELSAAFVFVFLCILALVISIKRKKYVSELVIVVAVFTIIFTSIVGVLAIDAANGKETVVTNVTFERRYGFHQRRHITLFTRFPDENGNIYWTLGGVDDLALSETIPTSVRIAYLPNTRYVLGIEKYVGDIPDLDLLLPFHTNNQSDYQEIYTNRDSWIIACIFAIIFIFIILTTEEEKKNELPNRTKTPLSSKKRLGK